MPAALPLANISFSARADLERDVEIVVVLRLELERHVRRLEEGEAGAVVHAIEGMQRLVRRPLLVSLISKAAASGRPRKSS